MGRGMLKISGGVLHVDGSDMFDPLGWVGAPPVVGNIVMCYSQQA